MDRSVCCNWCTAAAAGGPAETAGPGAGAIARTDDGEPARDDTGRARARGMRRVARANRADRSRVVASARGRGGEGRREHEHGRVRRGAPMRVWRQVRRSVASMALRPAVILAFALAASGSALAPRACGSSSCGSDQRELNSATLSVPRDVCTKLAAPVRLV